VSPIEAGKMRSRVTLQRQVETPDAEGGTAKEWRTVRTVWAEEITLSASKRAQAPKEMAARTSTFRMRYRDDVQSDWRIIYHGNAWRILGISPRGGDGSLEIMAEQVGVAGVLTSGA